MQFNHEEVEPRFFVHLYVQATSTPINNHIKPNILTTTHRKHAFSHAQASGLNFSALLYTVRKNLFVDKDMKHNFLLL
jgi:hypothetical protein